MSLYVVMSTYKRTLLALNVHKSSHISSTALFSQKPHTYIALLSIRPTRTVASPQPSTGKSYSSSPPSLPCFFSTRSQISHPSAVAPSTSLHFTSLHIPHLLQLTLLTLLNKILPPLHHRPSQSQPASQTL